MEVSMNDINDVQEIRRLLDEHRVDYDEYSLSRSHAFKIDYSDAWGDYFSEIEIFGKCIYVTKKYLTPEQAIAVALSGDENRISERLRGIASNMRNIEALSMTPHELFAYWAREVDKVADLATMLGVGECEIVTTEKWLPTERYHRCKICGAFFAINACPNCGKW